MKRKLRIAVDCRPALWSKMGIGSIAINFIENIKKVDPINEYFFYFDRDPTELYKLSPESNFKYCSNLSGMMWSNFYIASQLCRIHFDIYISFLERDVPIFKFGTKRLTLICDLIPLIYATSFFKNYIHQLYYRITMRYSVASSDHIFTISKSSKNDINHHYRIIDDKISIISLGTCLPSASDGGDVLTKYKIKKKYILAFGSTEPRKNNTRLIRAFNSVKSTAKYKDVTLVIVGKEWRGIKFDDSLLHNQIILTGYVPEEDMPHLFKNAEIVVFPSLYEGFGLPILEAMSYGVPVITSNTSSMPEVGGDAVLYVDPLNIFDIEHAIKKLLSDESVRNSFINKGLQQAKIFNWQTMCEEIVSSYNTSKH